MPQYAKQITHFADGRFHVALELDDGTIVTVALQAAGDEAPATDPADRADAAIVSLAEAIAGIRCEQLQSAADARERQDRRMLDEQLDEGLMDSFPASDPVSVSVPSTLPKTAVRE